MIGKGVAIDLLAVTAPGWFTVTNKGPELLSGIAKPADDDFEVALDLRPVIAGSPFVSVSETSPGGVLPARCPERHIQPDSTFCLGLRPRQIVDSSSASALWSDLKGFMACQATAEATGLWPEAHALDHGDAGEAHEAALDLAAELGVSDDYLSARLGEPSWVTNEHLKLVDRTGRPINGRLPCPRGCHWKRRPSRPVVRKDCKRRGGLIQLVQIERRRSLALSRFWSELRESGASCCGRMRGCQLAAPNAQSIEKRMGE